MSEELRRGWAGAMLLFRRDARGLTLFDYSLDGFWRSFLAPLAMIPLSLLVGGMVSEQPVLDPLVYFFVKGLGELGAVMLFPLLMVPLARLLGLGEAYVPYIVANNWAALPITLANVALAILVLIAGSVAGPAAIEVISLFVGLPVLVVILAYLWTIARLALGCGAATAAGLTAVQFLLTLIIDRITDQMLFA